ncbi:flagellar hook-associated protein FlgK [Sphingomonas sp. RS2018]
MSDLFAIGYSGVRAYQSALGTTSENIANAATPGYSRRSAVMTEVSALNSIALGQTTNLVGNGVAVNSLARSADQYKIADVRSAGADLARTETGIVWLERIEGALTANRLDERMTAFFNAAQGVAADPSATAPRTVMIEAATTLANAFTGTGQTIDTATENLKASGADAASRLTDLSASLARVNASLTRVTPGSTQQMQALDQRDQLLESMSALVDVSVDTDTFGRATVRAGGTTGPVIADADGSAFVGFTTNTSGAVAFVAKRGTASDVVPIHGGVFAGVADGAARLSGVRGALNDIATRFTTAVNTAQGNGRTLDNTPGEPLFATGGTPTDLRVAMTTPRGIAAAAIGEGTRGNGNLAALASLRTTGKFESGVTDIVTANAAALSARSDVASAQTSIRDAAVASASAVSGVDIDEEAVNLIRFQQAYQASSRVIQVARDVLQTIIDIR